MLPAPLTTPVGWGPGVQVPPEAFTDLTHEHVLMVIEQLEALKAWADDVSLTATEVLTRRAEADCLAQVGPDASATAQQRARDEARAVVADEISLATGYGTAESGARVAFAGAEPARCETLRAHLNQGTTTWWRARTVFHDTRSLPPTEADEVAAAVLAPTREGCGLSNGLFRQRLSRQLARRLNPRRARADALTQRSTSVAVTPVSTADLLISGDALRIVAAHDRLATIARALRAHGDPRTLPQLRSDIALDLLAYGHVPANVGADGANLGTDGAATIAASSFPGGLPAALVNGTVSLASLLGADKEPGHVDGIGYLPAHVVRELALSAGSTWRRLVTDPLTGHALELSTHSYTPTPLLRDVIHARDRYCRAAGCTIPATSCDLDHDTDYARGGPTSVDNLSAKHRRHHNHKTRGHWQTTQHPDGAITWHTWAGRSYTSLPFQYDDPSPRPTPLSAVEQQLMQLLVAPAEADDVYLQARGRTKTTTPHRRLPHHRALPNAVRTTREPSEPGPPPF